MEEKKKKCNYCKKLRIMSKKRLNFCVECNEIYEKELKELREKDMAECLTSDIKRISKL